MFVKSLTLRGFKSFASATTLRLEPGITCIVGPNGSGKSNVVDALAWVMGEQGAKTLRGGKMEDVIFAGTSGRAPLGRAEVALTIDNSDGALPIDYTEVTITRTMFRGGGSDYAINGTTCRLLDVQELLSDSGIGHEMHVVVNQGQLDAVLRASPEERRGFIEEAAGVLKHRKRKERALRKLDAMDGNLTRLADLTAEIRRQLGPLGRQAATARRAAGVQADARDARLRLLADDLVQLTSTFEREVADETALILRRTAVETALVRSRERLLALEEEAAAGAPLVTQAGQRWFAVASVRDRIGSTGALAAERIRLLSEEEDGGDRGDRRPDPDVLTGQADAVRGEERAMLDGIAVTREALQAALTRRTEAEGELDVERQRLSRLVQAVADRREGLARLAGEVGARRSRIEAGEAEIGRLSAALEQSRSRASAAEREFAGLEASIVKDEQGEEGLDAGYEQAAMDLEEAQAQVQRWQETERAYDRERAGLLARLEALELGLRRKDGSAALLAMSGVAPGLAGTVASLIQVGSGYETAVAAALGWAADALVARSPQAARDAISLLRQDDAGRAGLLVAATATPVDPPSWPAVEQLCPTPSRAVWARDVVLCPDVARAAVEQLLERVLLVDDADTASGVADLGLGVTAVTADGDVFAPGSVRGGGAGAPSLLETQVAVEETRQALERSTVLRDQGRFALAAAQEKARVAAEVADARLEALHDSDARMAAVAERLGQLGALVRSARAESERSARAIESAEGRLDSARSELADLQRRVDAAGAEPSDQHPSTADRERLDLAAAAAREAETEARLALRTQEERARAMAGRAEALEAAAREEIAARERSRALRERRAREAVAARAVSDGAAYALTLLTDSLQRATSERAAAERQQAERELGLAGLRRDVGVLGDQARELTDSVHRDEVARAEQRLRIEALRARAVEELGVDAQTLVEAYGPHQPVPLQNITEDAAARAAGADAGDDKATASETADRQPEGQAPSEPYVREAQVKRLRAAERQLALLGRINPLALEEFAALEERHTFLSTQMADLRASRRDLLDIVREVDERMREVFAEAYADTAAQFERVFARLFPGGEGRLVLTEPDDLLTTGIEIEARPPGKKIKRLSLLSGGERSLTAVALLIAIFTARPSPFYILDEVEAALDDTNLGRLLTLLEELRDSSQLIVITHQRRTMEIADALYGVTMRGDGVTTVVSQRIRDLQSA